MNQTEATVMKLTLRLVFCFPLGVLSFSSVPPGLRVVRFTSSRTPVLTSSSLAETSPAPQFPAMFRTTSKKPKKVIIDPRTGLYRPMKNLEEKSTFSLTWDGFKSFVYDGVDVLTTKVPKRIPTIQGLIPDVSASAPKHGQEEKSGQIKSTGPSNIASLSRSDIVSGGYKDREEEFIKTLEDVPGTLLKTEFKVPESVNERLNNAVVDDVLVEPSTFDVFKSLVYRGLDTISSASLSSDAENGSSLIMKSPMGRLPSGLQQREVQARLLASDGEFLQAVENLQSENALVRLAAGYKVRRMVEQDEIYKKRRLRAAEREKQVVAIKSSIYQAGDVLVGGVKALVELPPKVAETYESVVVSTRKTLAVTQSLPDQVKGQVESVQHKVEEVQQTIQKSVEATKGIIEKTKQLPSDIRSKVQETSTTIQKTAVQTKEVLHDIEEVAQDLATTSKVLLGLEKPVPKPPKAIPLKEIQDEMSLSKLGWKALRVTGSLVGKVTWALGKETTKLAWIGAELAWAKSKEAIDRAAMEDQRKRALAAAAFSPSFNTSGSVNTTLATVEVVKDKTEINDKDVVPVTPSVQTNMTSRTKVSVTTPPETDALLQSIGENMAPKQSEQAERTVLRVEQKDANRDVENPRSPERLSQRKEEIELSLLDLEQEIAEALRLADMAIESAQAEMDDVDHMSKTTV